MFLERWSPRAFTGEAIPHEMLMTHVRGRALGALGFNMPALAVPLRDRGTAEHGRRFLNLLIPYNQDWAKAASVLAWWCRRPCSSGRTATRSRSHSHSFDAGAAWASLALQA